MKITLYTITDCQFCKAEKEYLTQKGLAFEEKNLETNKEFLTEMLGVSNNFAGVPFTVIIKDDGSTHKLEGFTKEDFDKVFESTVASATPAVAVAPATPANEVVMPEATSAPVISAPVTESNTPAMPMVNTPSMTNAAPMGMNTTPTINAPMTSDMNPMSNNAPIPNAPIDMGMMNTNNTINPIPASIPSTPMSVPMNTTASTVAPTTPMSTYPSAPLTQEPAPAGTSSPSDQLDALLASLRTQTTAPSAAPSAPTATPGSAVMPNTNPSDMPTS